MRAPRQQRGIALVMAMVMLLVLTLISVSSVTATNSSVRIAGNMQAQEEIETQAQLAIETAISTLTNFTNSDGTNVLTQSNVDINGDDVAEYTVAVYSPVCENWVLSRGNSATTETLAPRMTYWDVRAEVTDIRTGAVTTIHQGIRILLPPAQSTPCDT